MKVIAPKPFYYRGGNKAVLLLHGFTGNTVDVRKLGKYLQERGYTCYAPLYKGHGLEPEKIIQTEPADWWQDVIDGYHFLKNEGFSEIAVAGISLGGVFSLRVGAKLPVKAVVSMCAPILEKSTDDLFGRIVNYAKAFKKLEGKDEEQILDEIKDFEQKPAPSIKKLQQFIVDTRQQLKDITSPTFVLQGSLDAPLNKKSSYIIYDHVQTEDKQIKWYERSGHIITLGEERETIYEDVYAFLNSLEWN
ncbi:alpha/beta hydrolase [Bacillus massiliigorillae]|uniref:alpha/beta hydrolase n=1 Tax=Bacillus massiliigorillae TaxID=1243664 RepID=UPI0003A8C3FD|nr:alpha/beta fold hydrolase [Bacillus massiliigorillae]